MRSARSPGAAHPDGPGRRPGRRDRSEARSSCCHHGQRSAAVVSGRAAGAFGREPAWRDRRVGYRGGPGVGPLLGLRDSLRVARDGGIARITLERLPSTSCRRSSSGPGPEPGFRGRPRARWSSWRGPGRAFSAGSTSRRCGISTGWGRRSRRSDDDPRSRRCRCPRSRLRPRARRRPSLCWRVTSDHACLLGMPDTVGIRRSSRPLPGLIGRDGRRARSAAGPSTPASGAPGLVNRAVEDGASTRWWRTGRAVPHASVDAPAPEGAAHALAPGGSRPWRSRRTSARAYSTGEPRRAQAARPAPPRRPGA